MKVKYFIETDTLYIQLNDRKAAETTELNENILVDIDQDGKVASSPSNTAWSVRES